MHPPSQLHGMVTQVNKAIMHTKFEYGLVTKRFYLHFDMKLVSFGIDNNSDNIIQFLVFLELYSQSLIILYQIKIVPVS